MKVLTIFLLFVVTACDMSPTLKEGNWTGTLTPMNHPKMKNPVIYRVAYKKDKLTITIVGPGGVPIPVRDPHINSDTLYFAFNEPEEQVLLHCALGQIKSQGFAGKCTDATGKWALFTMMPPK